MKQLVIILTIVFLTLPYTIASPNSLQSLDIVLRPKADGSLTPNTQYQYALIFSNDTECNNLLTILTNTTTDATGEAALNLNLSELTTAPSYLCEYRDGTLRKIHTLNTKEYTAELWTHDTDNYADTIHTEKNSISIGTGTPSDTKVWFREGFNNGQYLRYFNNAQYFEFSAPLHDSTGQVCTTGNGLCNGTGFNTTDLCTAANGLCYQTSIYLPDITYTTPSWYYAYGGNLITYAPSYDSESTFLFGGNFDLHAGPVFVSNPADFSIIRGGRVTINGGLTNINGVQKRGGSLDINGANTNGGSVDVTPGENAQFNVYGNQNNNGDLYVSGTIYYGTLQANSPILESTHDPFVTRCTTASDGTFVVQYIAGEKGKYTNTIEAVDPKNPSWYHQACYEKKSKFDLLSELTKTNTTKTIITTYVITDEKTKITTTFTQTKQMAYTINDIIWDEKTKTASYDTKPILKTEDIKSTDITAKIQSTAIEMKP